jgi:hypothetical protein
MNSRSIRSGKCFSLVWDSMPHSKCFAHDLLEARTAADQWAAAESYLESCKTDSVFHLSEIMIAEMILASKQNHFDQFAAATKRE